MPVIPLVQDFVTLWKAFTTVTLLATPTGDVDTNGRKLVGPVSAENPLPVTLSGGARATFLNLLDVYNGGFTPEQDGTLLVQNLSRTGFIQVYPVQAAPMTTVPVDSVQPLVSVGPLSWVKVPLQAGVLYGIVMNGNQLGIDDFSAVTAVFLPGTVDLDAGPMLRAAAPVVVPPTPGITSVVWGASDPNRFEITLTSGITSGSYVMTDQSNTQIGADSFSTNPFYAPSETDQLVHITVTDGDGNVLPTFTHTPIGN
ncbi:hypothetical protein [Deinococcus ruber]|uniref:Uncharacterized protein n=1 Tax=Deinococcus ruber TaxID=1848197 RepID=A0A918C817_9DEIO|nr:hypothetical protein [Deinococcus ruber]GGR11344.1 hypothetical protein GCM10008957_25090 [Deinococcus ruber]